MAMKARHYAQAWTAKIAYVTHTDDQTTITATLIADKQEIVHDYLERKFKRIAKILHSIEIKDAGFKSVESRLELIVEQDGTISANRANGEAVSLEAPLSLGGVTVIGTPYDALNAVRTTNPTYTYPIVPVHMPPSTYGNRGLTPALPDCNACFERVTFPKELHELGGGPNRFRAKFYNLFPKEK